jgi:hypothetical protein
LETIAASRSSSSSTTPWALISRSAMSPSPTAPATIPPGGDDGLGLLAAQHRLGDLGRVGEVGQPRLEDLDAGDGEPVLQLAVRRLGDLVRVAGERHDRRERCRPGDGAAGCSSLAVRGW